MGEELSDDQAALVRSINDKESYLVSHPKDKKVLRELVNLLDSTPSSAGSVGVYGRCQKAIADLGFSVICSGALEQRAQLIKLFSDWAAVLNQFDLNVGLPVAQLNLGQPHSIAGERSFCAQKLAFFDDTGVIPKFCESCFKVQILPYDLIAMMETYFLLSALPLPNDNARKCTIETRLLALNHRISYPYKGYIYCGSEEEAFECLEVFASEAKKHKFEGARVSISHGCYEYSMKYPQFEYSDDGAHRNFQRPLSWDYIEKSFYRNNQKKVVPAAALTKQFLTLRDVLAFRTWAKYAQLIGDSSYKVFQGVEEISLYDQFTSNVKKYAKNRHDLLLDIRTE
ncbi:MAG: hypothetical protein ACRBB6_10695 [Neptuniibacter sp.]